MVETVIALPRKIIYMAHPFKRDVICHAEHLSIMYLKLEMTFIRTVHSPTNVLLLIKKHIKIYIKIHINIAPTCFGFRPSSGSLH